MRIWQSEAGARTAREDDGAAGADRPGVVHGQARESGLAGEPAEQGSTPERSEPGPLANMTISVTPFPDPFLVAKAEWNYLTGRLK